jgi:hypothetical protein
VSGKLTRANPRPMPSDFRDVAMTMGQNTLGRHYACGCSTIERWLRELPAEYRQQRNDAMAERKRIGGVKGGRSKNKSADFEIVGGATIKGPHTTTRKPGSGYGAMSRWSLAAGPVNGLAGQAAQHLQRSGYTPVFHAGPVYEKQVLMGIYVVGKMRLAAAEMVDLARKHGFNENAWRDVVA